MEFLNNIRYYGPEDGPEPDDNNTFGVEIG